mmetsp:Transcript_57434/g.147703  ORF Transcript_57434/g.147703 Transcript_57434/m.147703 type:complete len:273 (-) Transcript_57434:16-834(-)
MTPRAPLNSFVLAPFRPCTTTWLPMRHAEETSRTSHELGQHSPTITCLCSSRTLTVQWASWTRVTTASQLRKSPASSPSAIRSPASNAGALPSASTSCGWASPSSRLAQLRLTRGELPAAACGSLSGSSSPGVAGATSTMFSALILRGPAPSMSTCHLCADSSKSCRAPCLPLSSTATRMLCSLTTAPTRSSACGAACGAEGAGTAPSLGAFSEASLAGAASSAASSTSPLRLQTRELRNLATPLRHMAQILRRAMLGGCQRLGSGAHEPCA